MKLKPAMQKLFSTDQLKENLTMVDSLIDEIDRNSGLNLYFSQLRAFNYTYVHSDTVFKVKRSDLDATTTLVIGSTYVVYPYNKRKKNTRRFVTVLPFAMDEADSYIVIRYQDNNRCGRAQFGDLVTHDVYTKIKEPKK